MNFIAPRFAAGLITFALAGLFQTTRAGDLNEHRFAQEHRVQRVLLISVDGLHAIDLARFVAGHPDSTLARLQSHGATYTQASSSRPSDSFPGLLAMVTGGSPNATGVWYDDSYSRRLSPPGSSCATIGTEVVFDESIDRNPAAVDGGGGIDPAKLPLDPSHGCRPVYPHSFLRVNTLFEVVRSHGGRTAWSDKHPAYDLVNGPSGRGVDDLYTPEIAANNTTSSVALTEAYDDTKVHAILNQIGGLDSSGQRQIAVPTVFGMNFQAVSVGQKLPSGGYRDGSGLPSNELADAILHTDESLGKMVTALQRRGLDESTLIVVSAKHGQAPVDPTKTRKLGKVVAALVPAAAQITQDDIALVWLKDPKQSAAVAATLRRNQDTAGIEEVLEGAALRLQFNDPAADERVPDLIVKPVYGVIYTSSKSKNAEHGGFTSADTNVALIVSKPGMKPRTIKSPVETTQIAPTILEALGIEPDELKAVRLERTPLLPGLSRRDERNETEN